MPAKKVLSKARRPGSKYRYDVALSFAGEDRSYVARVAKELSVRGVRVFYDRYEQAELWGKDLYVHLSEIYSSDAATGRPISDPDLEIRKLHPLKTDGPAEAKGRDAGEKQANKPSKHEATPGATRNANASLLKTRASIL